jgi:hypothetical protein
VGYRFEALPVDGKAEVAPAGQAPVIAADAPDDELAALETALPR